MKENISHEEMQLEFERDRIITKNVEFLDREIEKSTESFGGNAGSIEYNDKRYPASAMACIVNRKTGELIRMDWRVASEDSAIQGGVSKIYFHVALNTNSDPLEYFYIGKIVDIENVEEEARYRLQETTEMWNSNHGLKKPV